MQTLFPLSSSSAKPLSFFLNHSHKVSYQCYQRRLGHLRPQLKHARQNQQQFESTFLGFNPLRVSVNREEVVLKKKRCGFGTVCYAGPLTPRDLQWISTVSTAILMFSRGTAIHKAFLVPFFALQAPPSIVSWVKGEYGIWTAFFTLLVRLFFFIPGELELPFVVLLLILVAPYQVMKLRGTQEGVGLSLVIAAYVAFQHYSRAGSLRKAFDEGSIIASLAVICIVAVPCLLLIHSRKEPSGCSFCYHLVC